MDELLIHKLYFINELLERKSKMNQLEFNTISRGQGRVLAILKKKDNISTRDLAIILGISVSALNFLLNKLEKNGFIVKENSLEDKRVLQVKLTEKGRSYVIKPLVNNNIFDCLNTDQKQEFDSYLNLIINEIQKSIISENPGKFKKISQKRQELLKELFDENKEYKFWFDMFDE